MAFTVAFVVDSSMALAWCFPDEKDVGPQAVLDALASVGAIVPSLWHLETANILVLAERKGRCAAADVAAWTSLLAGLPIMVDPLTMTQAWSTTLDLARQQKLTVYDAAYLELAMRLGLPLATLDTKLSKAAKAAGVSAFAP